LDALVVDYQNVRILTSVEMESQVAKSEPSTHVFTLDAIFLNFLVGSMSYVFKLQYGKSQRFLRMIYGCLDGTVYTLCVSELEVHMILKVLTHIISFILNSFKNHIIDLGLKNKTSYIKHATDSYVFFNVIVQ
jgi:hypothetical protein